MNKKIKNISKRKNTKENNTFKLIANFRYLDIEEELTEPFTLMPGVQLITDKATISKVLDKEFEEMAGYIEYDYFSKANSILYLEDSSELFKSRPMGSHTSLVIWLDWINLLISDLWFVKEHSIECEMAYCKMRSENGDEWTSNRVNTVGSFSNGDKFKSISMTKEQLIEWEKISNIFRSYEYLNGHGRRTNFVDQKVSRVSRSYSFINAARLERNPAIKISHYCSSFESLFATDTSELSHKLAERVSIFMREFGYNGVEVFDKIKSFYAIRSKVTHGDYIKSNKINSIPELSTECDEYLRFIILKIINSKELISLFDGPKGAFEIYFKKKLLG